MKNTIVISAFPGLGKTTFFNKCKESNISVLDSDSINFSWLEGGTDRDGSNATRVRNPDFPNNYIEHIRENIGKVDIILVSSHKVVRDALNAEGIKYFVVYPNISLKEKYIERYIKRGSPENFVEMMHTNFESFVSELDNEIQIFQTKIKINESGIYLSDIIFKIQNTILEDKIKYWKENQTNQTK